LLQAEITERTWNEDSEELEFMKNRRKII